MIDQIDELVAQRATERARMGRSLEALQSADQSLSSVNETRTEAAAIASRGAELDASISDVTQRATRLARDHAATGEEIARLEEALREAEDRRSKLVLGSFGAIVVLLAIAAFVIFG